MAVVTWRTPFTLTSTNQGSIVIPQQMLDPLKCDAGIGNPGDDLRVTDDPIPGGDGMVFHNRFKAGYQMTIALNLYGTGVIELGTSLQAFYDNLMLVLDDMIDYDGTVSWVPDYDKGTSAPNARQLAACRTLMMPRSAGQSTPPTRTLIFIVESPYPYAMDAAADQTVTALSANTATVINRGGSAKEFYPVIDVVGPFTSMTLGSNYGSASGQQVAYIGTMPGATSVASGQFLKIDFFRKQVVIEPGDYFADAGVVWAGVASNPSTDFFPLIVGTNNLCCSGAAASAYWSAAWA